MEKSVYLAGPIDGLHYKECTDWRDYSIRELRKSGIVGVSPMRAKEFLEKHEKITDGVDSHVLITDAGITGRDMWDVRTCGMVLFNLIGAKKISVGTMIEYGWASAFNKPIATIIEKESNVHEHPMVRRLSNYRVENLDSGLAIVKALFAY